MPGPGGAPGGMGSMSPPGGEISQHLAKMMGSTQGTSINGPGSSNSGSSQAGSAQLSQAQQAAIAQQAGIPGGAQGEMGASGKIPSSQPPRDVGTIKDEVRYGFSDILRGLKVFFNLNTWLGINPQELNPEQQAHAQQLHSRYQQLDSEQQMVAKQMYEERMQKKKIEQEEEERKKKIEEEQKSQTIEMPSGPKKGPIAPASGQSKKQNALTKLKQDRTTLNNLGGE